MQILAFNLILLLADATLTRTTRTARQIFNRIEKGMTQDSDNACMHGNADFNNRF